MTAVQSSTAAATPPAAVAGVAAATVDDMQDRFLTLLVAQMKNQDPLSPIDNAQFTSQLAQINTVGGINQLNATLGSLRSDIDGLSALQSVSLAGRQVLVAGNQIALADGKASGGFDLAADAGNVSVSVLDAAGNVIHRAELGAQSAGLHAFEWDGMTDAGTSAAPGRYTVRVDASTQGKAVQVDPLAAARVEAVNPTRNGITLSLGALGTRALAEIRQIF